MANDLVHRLRTQPPVYGPKSDTQILRNEAAEEIWCLRQIVRDIRLMDATGAFKQWEGEPWLKRVRNIDLNR